MTSLYNRGKPPVVKIQRSLSNKNINQYQQELFQNHVT